MEQVPSASVGTRRNEDIALDLMKFIAMTTGFGKSGSASAGFQGVTTPAKPEEYADNLLKLYGRCLDVVQPKK